MFEIESFKQRLAETIAWCESRFSRDDPQNSLRTLLPSSVLELNDEYLIMQLVEPVVTIRSTLLKKDDPTFRSWNKPIPPLPIGLQNGRLLLFYPGSAVADPAAGIVTLKFFDSLTVPAWDTWICHGSETVTQQGHDKSFECEYLICWIPPQLHDMVDFATESDPTECIQWLNKVDVKFSFLPIFRAEGLLG